MSSISLSLKMLLAGSALAGLTLLACGGDDSSGGGDEKEPTGNSKSDAGNKGKDAGNSGPKKDATAPAITKGEPGEDCSEATVPVASCDSCDESFCVTRCTDDGVWGDCESAVSAAADAGFTIPKVDAGFGRDKDGGFTLEVDGSTIPLPTAQCPAEFSCSDALSGFMLPDLCAKPGAGPFGLDGPPMCATTDDCAKVGLKVASCVDTMIIGKLCLAPCTK